MSVLAALAAQAVARISRLALGGPGRRAATGTLAALGAVGVGIPGVDLFPDGDGAGGRRRRRRNMFTATDLAQFAVVEALAGKSAVKSVMMVRAARA